MIAAQRSQPVSPRTPLTLSQILESYERIILIKAIQSCGGSRSGAAASLGVRRGYLYERLRKLHVDLKEIPCRLGRPPQSER